MKAVRGVDGGVAVVDVEEPPGRGTELLTMVSASVCASDLSYVKFGSTSIIGHEVCGIGADGNAYTLEALMPCYECEVCLSGATNLCPTHKDRAVGYNYDGAMAEQYFAPARNLVPVPEGISARDAAIVEPATVSWHALRVAGMRPGQRVAVVGAGGLGLLAAAGALEMGAAEVSVEARHPYQQEAVERIGAKVGTSGSYDVVIEAAGSESSLNQCLDLAGPGSTVSVLGVHYGPVTINWQSMFHHETRLVPSMGYSTTDGRRDMVEAAAMLASKPDLVSTVITHRFPIEEAGEAFRVAGDRSSKAIRVVLDIES